MKLAQILLNARARLGACLLLAAAALAPAACAADAFPAVIEHRYGTTIVPAKPQRIVSLSFIGHDFFLALGEKPHALRKWFGDHPYGVWPWAQAALGDARPIVLQGQIDIERIAALEPDLITGQWSGMTEREYALLSRIAPTVAPKAAHGSYGSPWQVMLRTLGTATGQTAKAEQIISRIEGRFAAIRAAHPEWQGASVVMVSATRTGAYSASDIRGQFLAALGFTVPEVENPFAPANSYYALLPDEDLSPIDTDALIWIDAGGSVPRLKRLPLRHTLRAYREGREIYAGRLLSSALSHSSPLSLDAALDQLVPLLEAALDGDPGTPVSSMAEAGLLPEGR
ncbi:ABC transporter substrate-binding protein [Leisingera aquaemixtae]|uniref:Putative siderophore-binding lipoprotein YfiY n=1 Tax=Leisingera aquaemixtae TaxID=1396826 RepID=A0A0P1H6Z9_9RHOB|nr:ABC transporter substrate-binding protein [Leisingera aquaemixtae]CUH98625.1 putative siderophore-binding lipoprotein YfiY precursor [Leisingera aquaemixtae]